MTAPALDHDQGNARAASGELAFFGMGLPARIAGRHKFQESGSSRRRGERGAPTCRSFTAPAFLSRGWSGHPDEIAAYRTRTYAGLTAEQVAALLEFNPSHHVLADFTDGSEHRSSSSAHALDDQDRDRPGARIVGKVFQYGA